MLYQFIFFNNKQILTDIIRGKLPSHAAIRIRISYDRSTRGRASATSGDSCVGYLSSPKRLAATAHEPSRRALPHCPSAAAGSRAFHAMGMRMELRGKQRLQHLGENSPKLAAGGFVPKNADPRVAIGGIAALPGVDCQRALQGDRCRARIGPVGRRMRGSLRRHRRVPHRRRVVGLRRSTGGELEPRLAAPRRSRTAVESAPRTAAAHRRAAVARARCRARHHRIRTRPSGGNSQSRIIATVRRATSLRSRVRWPFALTLAIALACPLAADATAADTADGEAIAPTATAPSPGSRSYRVTVDAPSPLKETLLRDVGLVRWQGYAEMTDDLLERLAREAVDEARGMAAAEGYFSAPDRRENRSCRGSGRGDTRSGSRARRRASRPCASS